MAQSRPRILVVDDVEDNVFTLERRLKQFVLCGSVPEAQGYGGASTSTSCRA